MADGNYESFSKPLSEKKDQPPPAPVQPVTKPGQNNAYDSVNSTAGPLRSSKLIPVKTKEKRDKYLRCRFCKRSPTFDEQKKGRCTTCKIKLEPRVVPWGPKRIAVTLGIVFAIAVVACLVAVGIYVAATSHKRKQPKWEQKGWCDANATVKCDLYQMKAWGDWSEWNTINTCQTQTRTATREIWAQGTCCPATTRNQTRRGPPCCEGVWSVPDGSNDYHYCFKKIEAKTFDEAQKECEGHGGGLAVPVNESQADWFKKEAGGSYWIGITLNVKNDETQEYKLYDPEKLENAKKDLPFGFARWDNVAEMSADPAYHYMFATTTEVWGMIPYDECRAQEGRFRCDEKIRVEVWHSETKADVKRPSFCKIQVEKRREERNNTTES